MKTETQKAIEPCPSGDAFLTQIRKCASGFGEWDNDEPLSFEDTYRILESSDWFFVDDAAFVTNSPHGKINDQRGRVVAVRGLDDAWTFYTLSDHLGEVSHFANDAEAFKEEWQAR